MIRSFFAHLAAMSPKDFWLGMVGILGLGGFVIMAVTDVLKEFKKKIAAGRWDVKPSMVVYGPDREVKAKYFEADEATAGYIPVFLLVKIVFVLSLVSLITDYFYGIGFPFHPVLAVIMFFFCGAVLVFMFFVNRFERKHTTA